MTDADRAKFAESIVAMAATFGREVDQPALLGYWYGLCDLNVDDVQRAIIAGIRTKKFMPAVAELRELAGELPPATRALVAWDALCRAVAEHGGYRSVAFDDPALTASIRQLGGWQRICDTPADQFDVWLRKDFLSIYVANLGRPIRSNPALLGIFDRPPVLVSTGLPVSDVPMLEGSPSALAVAAEKIGRMPQARRNDDAA